LSLGAIGCQPVGSEGYPAAQQRVHRGPPYYSQQQAPEPSARDRYAYRDTQMPAEPRPAPEVRDYLAHLDATQSPGQPRDPYAQAPSADPQLGQSQFRPIQNERRLDHRTRSNPERYNRRPIDPSRTAQADQYNETPYNSLYGQPHQPVQQSPRLRQTPPVTHAPVPGDSSQPTRQLDERIAQTNPGQQSRVQSNVPIAISQRGPQAALALQGPPRLARVSIREGQEPTPAATSPQVAARPDVARPNRVENTAPDRTAITQPVTPRRKPMDEMIAASEAELAARPSDARVQWRKSMLHLAAGQEDKAGAISEGLTQEQRGLLARQVAVDTSVHNVLNGDRESVDRAYEAASALRDALREGADLLLPTLALCSKVTTFGVYDELPDSALKPYTANQAIVYCEVKNLAAQRDDVGNYRTRLATRMELFTADGRSMWRHSEDQIEDVARQRREDFFVAQLVRFPEDLGPGAYILKATVTDLLSSKTNEVSQRIQIGDSAALTSARR
jgi:hypothetical protein